MLTELVLVSWVIWIEGVFVESTVVVIPFLWGFRVYSGLPGGRQSLNCRCCLWSICKVQKHQENNQCEIILWMVYFVSVLLRVKWALLSASLPKEKPTVGLNQKSLRLWLFVQFLLIRPWVKWWRSSVWHERTHICGTIFFPKAKWTSWIHIILD